MRAEIPDKPRSRKLGPIALRLHMAQMQAEEPEACGVCGHYLYGYSHMHYVLRWVRWFRQSHASRRERRDVA